MEIAAPVASVTSEVDPYGDGNVDTWLEGDEQQDAGGDTSTSFAAMLFLLLAWPRTGDPRFLGRKMSGVTSFGTLTESLRLRFSTSLYRWVCDQSWKTRYEPYTVAERQDRISYNRNDRILKRSTIETLRARMLAKIS